MNPEVHFDGPSVWQHRDREKQQLERGLYLWQYDVRWPRARLLMDAGKKNISVKRIINAFFSKVPPERLHQWRWHIVAGGSRET